MKKLMILLAAMAMTTLAAQAEDIIKTTDAVVAMETEAPAPTAEDDTNGTQEEAPAPEGK